MTSRSNHTLPLKWMLLGGLILVFSNGQGQNKSQNYNRDDLKKLPLAPDYSSLYYWAAHPEKNDEADKVPGRGELTDNQDLSQVDVFFVHPTIYSGRQVPAYPWNADVHDPKINADVDASTIRNQASVFNGTARVFAPRYRQAHLGIFSTDDKKIKDEALDNAYTDIKNSFEYYLENENQERPIIIAGHSQGTLHAVRLLNDFFQGNDMAAKLVAAYIIGMPLRKDLFETFSPCEVATETGCWITWNTYEKGYYPESFYAWYKNALSVNPLNWKTDDTYAPRDENKGGVLKNFNKIRPGLTDAQNHKGILWVEKPHFFWRFLLKKKRYHIADYNLFYVNIRENVAQRVEYYLSPKSTENIGSGN